MATNIQRVVSEMSSTPTNGEPWNFNGILEAVLIPRTIVADKKLPPGARLLWGIIRQYSFRDGICYSSDETLRRLLAVSERQLERYAKALELAGLLRTTQRPGKTAMRELLWNARFDGKIRKRVDRSVGEGRQMCRGASTDVSGTYKEEGVLKGSSEVKSAGVLKKPWATESELRANKPAAEWNEEDYIRRGRECGFPEHVIQRDAERMRARLAQPQKERMKKASELKEDVETATRQ